MKRINIIGFGNLLMSDDGAGIHLVQHLARRHLPENIQLHDGGVASFEVLDAARNADQIIIIDVLAGGGQPGDIYRLDAVETGDLSGLSPRPLSLHEDTLLQSLQLARCAGPFPPVTIYGIEPGRITFGTALTPAVSAAVERLTDLLTAKISTALPK